MIHRLVELPPKHSFFLFGARGTGKTTLLKSAFPAETTYFINLLNYEQEERFLRDPGLLGKIIDGLDPRIEQVIIDEIQKVPRLLDVVHLKIEQRKRQGNPLQFILTGSSARKLRHGAANLLAGRAFVNNLYPFTSTELGEHFDLQLVLEYGALPEVWETDIPGEKRKFLESYSRTYLKEEVWNEHIIRKIEPFSQFLEIAAQMNGKILNYAKIGRDVRVDIKTIQSYYQILEDTLLGFFLPVFHRSLRKRQLHAPKFYLFDTGVKRALDHTLTVPLLPQTSAFGEAFEHFIILELKRLSEYRELDFRFFYLQTHDGGEVDLAIERPGRPPALVEIKSSERIGSGMFKNLESYSRDIPEAELFCLSRDPQRQRHNRVSAMPWKEGINELVIGN